MKVKSIKLQNFRSFEQTDDIKLSDINILIGENNSGKSSILRALHHLQQGVTSIFEDIRVGSSRADIKISIENSYTSKHWKSYLGERNDHVNFVCILDNKQNGKSYYRVNSAGTEFTDENKVLHPNTEPNHFIVPFFSKRKTGHYLEEVRIAQTTQITSDTSNLAAKLARINTQSFPGNQEYTSACKEILGFVVGAIPSLNGQRPGVYLSDGSTIAIDQMGEGVPNIVLLLTNLAHSKNKLFLIEEPENDLHPKALKALLDLIKKSSEHNQFVISTHSNVVVTHMCSEENSTLFKVTSKKEKLPTTASIKPIGNDPSERIEVLQELGYAFSDYELWEGWLLLEESSAERIIRDYLIPWFAPKLSRIKTVSAGGVNNVELAFKDLHRLMLFTHLQPAYAGKAWVLIDGDTSGEKTIKDMKEKFPSINPSHFSTFDKDQFEYYYPNEFIEKTQKILSISDKKEKREAKRELLIEVTTWLDANPAQAKKSLEISAATVINELKKIESELS